MPLYFDKILTQLAYPLGLSLSLCLLAVLLVWFGWRRLGAGLVLLAVAWVGVWSLPVASDALRLSLEARHAQVPAGALPQADAVVVLGGAMHPEYVQGADPNLGAAADRVWHAARIFHAGRAPQVVVSGGNLPWLGGVRSEAAAMRDFLGDLGVPAEVVWLEERSRNTRENALYTAEILEARGIGPVLLVTSALHMPRALATFRAAGVDAIPAPTDFEVMPRPRGLLDWLPDADALAASTRALKEYLGLWVYRWRGWA
jgi:uncharacterized SAM-binding protein YcdF (DUF218 family)